MYTSKIEKEFKPYKNSVVLYQDEKLIWKMSFKKGCFYLNYIENDKLYYGHTTDFGIYILDIPTLTTTYIPKAHNYYKGKFYNADEEGSYGFSNGMMYQIPMDFEYRGKIVNMVVSDLEGNTIEVIPICEESHLEISQKQEYFELDVAEMFVKGFYFKLEVRYDKQLQKTVFNVLSKEKNRGGTGEMVKFLFEE